MTFRTRVRTTLYVIFQLFFCASQIFGSARSIIDAQEGIMAGDQNQLLCLHRRSNIPRATALSSFIRKLPETERIALACFYGATMTHCEIAALLTVQRHIVSDAIQSALHRLQKDLNDAGIAETSPFICKDSIYDALTSGHVCPEAVLKEVFARIESAT